MFTSPSPPRFALLLGALATLGSAFLPRLAAANEMAPAADRPATPQWDFFRFVDDLPDSVADRLPSKKPSGALRVYLRPRYGDLIRRDYLRMPFGARLQVTENIECTSELQSYFTTGLAGSAGYGLSGLLLGVKYEHLLPAPESGAFSAGINYATPFSRPPQELTDGHRHLLPYITATRPLLPEGHVLGYTSLGADLLQHTAMLPHFGRNELHANSLVITGGLAREWPRFRAALTASLASTALMSNERRQVFALNPEVILPLRPAGARTRVLFTVGGHAVWGPGGQELGVSSSVRIEAQLAGGNR